MRIALGALAIILGIGSSGCWLAALQLAPAALEAAGTVASDAVQLASGAAIARHSKKVGDDPADQEERCDELEIEVPGVIEFRTTEIASAPEWRELQLGGSMDAPHWEPLFEQDAAPGGWHRASNLAAMKFAPPIDGALKPGMENYLAYAPVNPQTSVEQDQLVAMTIDFGAGIGTFQWKGRSYQYSLVNELPCFPASLALK